MNITELAREAGFSVNEDSRKHQPKCIWHTRYLIDEELTRFAALVRAQALEEVADAVEGMDIQHPKYIAAAIRALKEKL